MVSTDDDQAGRNRAVQVELYGEPLGELFRRISEALGLTQARLASIIGLSAPMLSQLMSGRRAKIGHPAVVQRVQALHELAEDVAGGRATVETVRTRLEEIQAATGGAFTGTSGTGGSVIGTRGDGARVDGGRGDGREDRALGSSPVPVSGSSPGMPAGLAGLDPRTAVHLVQGMLRTVAGADELLTAVELLRPRHPELAEFLRIYGAGRTSEALRHYEGIRAEL